MEGLGVPGGNLSFQWSLGGLPGVTLLSASEGTEGSKTYYLGFVTLNSLFQSLRIKMLQNLFFGVVGRLHDVFFVSNNFGMYRVST